MFVVAGVTGHVGSVVAQELLGRSQKIKVIVRDAAKGEAWSKQGAEVAVGSLADQAFLSGALRGAGGFFALLPPNFHAKAILADQRKTADAITAAVKSAGVRHVVMLSSVGADVPKGTGPIQGLHYLENALRGAGVRLTAIRAGYFQENLASSVAPARQHGVFPSFMPSADLPMPMIATHDIGVLAAQALLDMPAKNEAIDLHGPSYTQRQLAEKLGAALGKTLQIVDIPEPGWIPTLVQAGLRQDFAELYAEMYRGFGSGLIKPAGDRMVQGQTPIDNVVKALAG
jgi:uncharacterized protein YbjT (DUF2867 family)